MDKPEWEIEMEEYFGNMSEEEFQQFLIDTEFEKYNKIKTNFLGFGAEDES